jgi:hypothetical protein
MNIFEQSNDIRSTCILSSNVINDIITQHNILNNDFENMHVSDEIQNLSLLFNMSFHAMIPTNKDFFMIRNMKKQLIENNTCNEKLLVKYNGLQCDTKNTLQNLTCFHFYFYMVMVLMVVKYHYMSIKFFA